MHVDFVPPPTIRRFMLSDARMRVVKGPVGSGKSVGCSVEVVRRASMQKPGEDGFRHTRWAVVRNTMRQLTDTTIKTFTDWFPPGPCGNFMRTTKTYFMEIGDVRCEVMFRALDDADDVANLNSLELTGAWFNECRDIHPEIVDAMSKRVGRYPSMRDGGPTWHGVWADTNPPVMDTWWMMMMEGLDPEDGVSPIDNGWDVFHQPSGRSPEAENIQNLPKDYYDTKGRSDEYIRVFIDGEYGHSLAGTPVYKYFNPNFHMARETLQWRRPDNFISRHDAPTLVVGMDLGLTPAAVIGAVDPLGRFLVYGEVTAFDMGVQRFVRTLLKPYLNRRFGGARILVSCDPAGRQRAQTDERTAIDIIKAEGLLVVPAPTNNLTARISAVDDFLNRQTDGKAAFLLDPSCTALKAAMMGGYRFKKDTENVEKNKHSHVAEALQYLALNLNPSSFGVVAPHRRPVIRHSARGWT